MPYFAAKSSAIDFGTPTTATTSQCSGGELLVARHMQAGGEPAADQTDADFLHQNLLAMYLGT